MAFWNKPKPAPEVSQVKSSARPGVGSDPAPYLPDNERNWAETPLESKGQQDARLDRNPRSRAWLLGVPGQTELTQLQQTTRVLNAVQTTDDNHTERRFVDDPYSVHGAPTPIRPRLVPFGFRELAKSVQRFGAHNQRNGPDVTFSMASQKRTYSIGGMTPVMRRRNTYRLEPPPIDVNTTDLPSSGTRFAVPATVTVSANAALRGVRMLR